MNKKTSFRLWAIFYITVTLLWLYFFIAGIGIWCDEGFEQDGVKLNPFMFKHLATISKVAQFPTVLVESWERKHLLPWGILVGYVVDAAFWGGVITICVQCSFKLKKILFRTRRQPSSHSVN